MNEFLHALTATDSQFMPHGMCYAWRPGILWLNVGSDLLIVVAYLSIPFALITFVRRRDDLEFRWIFELFAAFIILCALTHFMSAWVVWNPDYAVHGMVKLLTALVSLTTAAVLWPLIPRALALPSPAQLRRVNESLARANDRLEESVAKRTAELETKQKQLIELNEDLKRRDAEITKLMLTDPLTEVANRRRLDEVLEAEVERNRRHGNPLCIVYMDIDNFKRINDSHGHQVGDRVLKAVAATTAAQLRINDTVVRHGGDEFILVLPETGLEGALQLLQRTREKLSALTIPGTNDALSISMGVALLQDDETRDELLHRADDALYKAKHAGKDRIVVSE